MERSAFPDFPWLGQVDPIHAGGQLTMESTADLGQLLQRPHRRLQELYKLSNFDGGSRARPQNVTSISAALHRVGGRHASTPEVR